MLWISVVLGCVLPFCFLRDITPLKAAGIVSVVAVSFMTAVIVSAYALPSQLQSCELYGQALTCAVDVVRASSSVKNILSAIPVFFFNYSRCACAVALLRGRFQPLIISFTITKATTS